MIHVVVGQDHLRDLPRIETLGAHVDQNPLQRVAGGHAAIDQRQLVAAVHQVDVAVGVIGKPEGVRDPSAHDVDLVRDTHRLIILLILIEAR